MAYRLFGSGISGNSEFLSVPGAAEGVTCYYSYSMQPRIGFRAYIRYIAAW